MPGAGVKSKRFGEPAPALPTTFGVALAIIVAATLAGVVPGFDATISAATPATCGDAIDVPEMVLTAVSASIQLEVMPVPGAKMSTQVPMFEYTARVSVLSVAPTVMAEGVRAGEVPQAGARLGAYCGGREGVGVEGGRAPRCPSSSPP